MRVTHITLRDFRSYESASVALGDSITVLHGPNGAGKTNLLEAIFMGCTGRSCRTAADREVVRFGTKVGRVELAAQGEDGPHELSVGIEPGEGRRIRADGVAVDRMLSVDARPLAAVFLPDRLELIKGAPAVRRAHLDQVVAGLWPARAATRRAYAQALAQRNALLGRVRAGASRDSLASWDRELARRALALMEDRASAIAELAPRFSPLAAELGLAGEVTLAYRPRSRAHTAQELADELAERLESDLERGFTGHGPHRDEVAISHDGREVRVYGSQGQQRLALLALLLAEREAIGETRGRPPLLLLDDVMSELDAERRERLMELVRTRGQTVITTTDLGHVPGADADDVVRIRVADGQAVADSDLRAAEAAA